MTHSPSPWRRAGKNSGHIWAPDGDGIVQVAIVGAYSDKETLPFNRERWDADARLISAAPEMLEALEAFASVRIERAVPEFEASDPFPDDKVLFGYDDWYLTVGMVRAARAAISKAKGTT